MGPRELGRFGAWKLQLLEGNNDSRADRDHKRQDECALLLIATACLVHPARQQRGVTPIATSQDENGHPQTMRDIPRRQHGVHKREQAAHRETHWPTAPDLVGDEARAHHDNKVDRANGCGDVVDLRDGVLARGLEIQPKELHDVRAGSERPEAVPQREGVHLPRTEDPGDDAPVPFANGLSSFLFDALPRPRLLPVIEVEGRRVLRGIGEEDLMVC